MRARGRARCDPDCARGGDGDVPVASFLLAWVSKEEDSRDPRDDEGEGHQR